MPFANTVNKMFKSTGLFVLLYLVLINAYTLVMLQIFFPVFPQCKLLYCSSLVFVVVDKLTN